MSELIKKGRALTFGDNIDTDQIYPGQYLDLVKEEELALHALEGADPNFVKEVQKGDIVVAGTNFGCGSSREYAPRSIKATGASAIIASSFARIFFRNAMNIGLPVIICKDFINEVEKYDSIKLDISTSTITNERTGKVYQGEAVSEYALKLIESGTDIMTMILNERKC